MAPEPGLHSGLRSGETIAAAVDAFSGPKIDAFSFNCTWPEAIRFGLAELPWLTDTAKH